MNVRIDNRCHRGHAIFAPGDLRSNGQCAKCSRDNEREYRRRCREAYAYLKAAPTA